MFCNFCENHRSEGHSEGCPDNTGDKVLVQVWNRGYKAGIDDARILDTNATFQLGYSKARRVKDGISLL